LADLQPAGALLGFGALLVALSLLARILLRSGTGITSRCVLPAKGALAMLSRSLIALASGAVFLSATAVTAQRTDQEPRNGACFYEDVNFGGDFFCVRTGGRLDTMPSGMNDRISSIRTFGSAEAQVYRNSSLGGGSARFSDDAEDLRQEDWNDQISSVQVRSGPHADRDGAYADRSFRNATRIVRRAYRDILDRQPDAEGLRHYRSRVIDDGWTEAQVRQDLRNSPEYRDETTANGQLGLTRASAENVVRRAYRAVLNREPDPASEGYVEHVLRDGWTQRDVEQDLRRSAEYRNRVR
jgi:hypothetical protein